MSWFGKAVAVVLLALWAPVTMHCELEAMPAFEFLQCCCGTDAPTSPSDCAQTAGCSAVESGLCKIEDEKTLAPDVNLVLAYFATDFVALAPLDPACQPVSESPPPLELARIWQFSYRTALPPRAPSPLI